MNHWSTLVNLLGGSFSSARSEKAVMSDPHGPSSTKRWFRLFWFCLGTDMSWCRLRVTLLLYSVVQRQASSIFVYIPDICSSFRWRRITIQATGHSALRQFCIFIRWFDERDAKKPPWTTRNILYSFPYEISDLRMLSYLVSAPKLQSFNYYRDPVVAHTNVYTNSPYRSILSPVVTKKLAPREGVFLIGSIYISGLCFDLVSMKCGCVRSKCGG